MNARRSCLHLGLLVGALIIGGASADGRDDLLKDYETGEREFTRVQIGDRTVYSHQRMLNGAIVEKDFIVYQFDRDTGEFVDKKIHWRPDLPEELMPVVPRDQAESMAEGAVQFSELYVISPRSDVFPLDPTPENPCWVVRSIKDDRPIVTIIDAVTGRHLGFGVPPPQVTGFAMSGAQFSEPCEGAWTSWYMHAKGWFEDMGYPTATARWPTDAEIISRVSSNQTAVFYEIGHSHGTHGLLFCSGCQDGYWCVDTTADEIQTWISGYCKMPFTFLASCYGLCDVGPGTLSYAFRKGSNTDTATVGYCDMSESYCSLCWDYSLDWQEELFYNMAAGDTVKQAYDKAMAAYSMCAPAVGWCMRFAGDESFAVVPVVQRGTCGNIPDRPGPEQPIVVPKNRYISLVPGNPGKQTALRVTLSSLPAPLDLLEGIRMWIGQPQEISENAGKVAPPPYPSFMGANLQCTPHCMDWDTVGLLHVTDDEIIPGAVYDVQTIDCGADFGNEASYSPPLTITTCRWGDVVKDCTTCPCGLPDGSVGIPTDVTAVVDKFRNLGPPTILCEAISKARADVEPNLPDWLVNISDVTEIVDAFRGFAYPPARAAPPPGWTGPTGCPPPPARIEMYSDSGCLPGSEGEPDSGTEPCVEDDQIELIPGPGTLSIMHRNASYNCCQDDILVSLSVVGNVLRLTEEEVPPGGYCDCICCFNVESIVVDLAPGEYTVEYCWLDYETGPRCHVEDVVIPEAQARVGEYSNSGCLDQGHRSSEEPCIEPDRIELAAEPGTLHVLHNNATYNCCPDDIVFLLSVEGNVIRLREEEILTLPCPCLCCYNVEATVIDLPPGEYTVELCWYDYETFGEECHQQDIVIP